MSFTHIPAQCPRCRSVLRVRRELLGQPVCCVYCNEVFEPGRKANPGQAGPSRVPTPDPRPGRPTPGAQGQGQAAPGGPFEDPRAPRMESSGAAAEANDARSDAAELAARKAELDALRADLDRVRAEADALATRLIVAREDANRLREALAEARASAREPNRRDETRLPVLVQDLARWSAMVAEDLRPRTVTVAVAVAVGPPPLPPSLDDLAAVERHTELLRALLRTSPPPGKPFHSLFDAERFQAFQAKLRESALLAERLINNVERSRNQKEVMWHLMVAQRTDELQRKRR